MQIPALLLASALLAPAPAASDPCEGNGFGQAYIVVGPAYIGGLVSHDLGSPAAPSSFVLLAFSGGFQPSFHPLVGDVCLDLGQLLGVVALPTDATGNAHLDVGLPPIPSLVSTPPFYSTALTFEGGGWSVAKTVGLWLENPNSWTPVAPMQERRLYHTATALGAGERDGRTAVLVAGGGALSTVTLPNDVSATTEVFDPKSRTFAPGPSMSVPRATHTATRLADGRVLLAGGLDSSGLCHASADLYDHATGAIVPAAPMSAPRAAHTATLLADGRVLVAGGFADYQNPTTAWAAALETAQDTAEIFDPSTGLWTPLAAPMQAARAGHTATRLTDGRVLLVGGVEGAIGEEFPRMTATVDLFDPATGAFTPLPDVPMLGAPQGVGRAYHGATRMQSGDVLVCAGVISQNLTSGAAISMRDCQLWNGGAWVGQSPLPVDTAWHGQVLLASGKVLIAGGLDLEPPTLPTSTLTPKAFTGHHVGFQVQPLGPIGQNPGLPSAAAEPRGAMSATVLHDGSVLFLGGTYGSGGGPLDSGYVYTPFPH